MKVLVIQQKMIGDVLASTVICDALKTNHPNWIIHFMIQPNTAAVVESNPFIDKIVFFSPPKKNAFLELIRFGRTLKKEKYDVVIDAYGKWESIIPAFFSGAKTRIGFKKWYTSILYTSTVVPKKNTEGSAIVHRLQLAEALLQKKNEVIYPKIYLSEEEIQIAKKSISEQFNTSLPIIMISVLGSGKKKSLPANQMADILDIIAYSGNLQLLFNFMPNQLEEAREIYNLCKPETQHKIVFDFNTKGLRALLGILSQCDALIGNEGGAVNMGKALNIPTFAIFSPWINKSSWNILTDNKKHIAIHLKDYFPEIYGNKHPKNFKNQTLVLYKKLTPNLYRKELTEFVKTIIS